MRRARQRGHAILELAICATTMVSCLTGTFAFGHTFYVYNQLVTAVGNGGRYAALRTYRAGSKDDLDKGAQAIRNMVVFGDAQPAADAPPAIAHLTPDQVEVHWVTDAAGVPSAVSVSIKSYTIDAIFTRFTFTGKPAVEFPYVGRYAPSEHEP